MTERRLKIINESNIECLFDIVSSDPQDKHKKDRRLVLMSSVKIDNEFENMVKQDSPHMILQPVPLEHEDVLERLIRMNQNFKSTLQHAINLGDRSYQILSKINKIDYLQ